MGCLARVAPLVFAVAAAACGGASPSQRCDSAAPGTALCDAPTGGARVTTGARELIRPEALDSGRVDIALAEGERAAIFVVNAAGRDGAAARLDAVNVAAPSSPAAPTLRSALAFEPAAPRPPPGDAGVLAAGAPATATATPLASARVAPTRLVSTTPPARTSFCVLRTGTYDASERRSASLVATKDRSLLYVDDGATELTAAEAAQLADAFDERILPRLTRLLGAPSDVDGNGKVILLVTPLPGLWGYYWANDVLLARDATADCSGTRSNGSDIVYVTPPGVVTAAGWSRSDALGAVIPGVVAHELSHLLSYQRRCLARTCLGPDETWVEEGIAKVAEDEAGFGWNVSRGAGYSYLTRTREEVFRGYDGRSLTRWEGDSVGNYEGAHAFFRFYADRFGPEILASLTSGTVGTRNVERALGVSLPEAMSEVAAALLFSNSAAAPQPDASFTGAAWTPLADKVRRLDTVPLGPAGATASLRADGWNAFLTGPAAAGGGTVRIASDEAVKPWIAVVRFRGDL